MESHGETEIAIPYPDATDLHLRISVGACRLEVRPGSGEMWVEGVYREPAGVLPVEIRQEGGSVKISQRRTPSDFLEAAGRMVQPGKVPVFDLTLGTARPFVLTVETGGSECILDLGGVPLSRLMVKQGAGKFSLDFSAPNPEPMSLLSLSAGAAGVEMDNLANANVAEMVVEGGAAGYRFDFGGNLQRDAHVGITTGAAAVEIRIPATTAAKIISESFLATLDIGDGFMKREGAFWTEAALEGKTPRLTIEGNVSLGTLRLTTT